VPVEVGLSTRLGLSYTSRVKVPLAKVHEGNSDGTHYKKENGEKALYHKTSTDDIHPDSKVLRGSR
jgi:hypothetical protein